MLPTETFTEAVAFLRLFDLSALAVTNAMCSLLAIEASNKLRWEQFPGLQFDVADKSIEVSRIAGPQDDVAMLTFTTENDMVDFIAAAFPNCIFDDVIIPWDIGKHLLDAIARVADYVILRGAIHLQCTMSRDDALVLVRKFRKVKALRIAVDVSQKEVIEIANFYRGSGVQELQYYSNYDWELKKLALC